MSYFRRNQMMCHLITQMNFAHSVEKKNSIWLLTKSIFATANVQWARLGRGIVGCFGIGVSKRYQKKTPPGLYLLVGDNSYPKSHPSLDIHQDYIQPTVHMCHWCWLLQYKYCHSSLGHTRKLGIHLSNSLQCRDYLLSRSHLVLELWKVEATAEELLQASEGASLEESHYGEERKEMRGERTKV